MSLDTAFLAALFLLAGNAFFVGAEFSMVAVRRSAIESKAASGSKRALTTLGALENLSFLMAGAQLGITLCSLALGAVAEPAIARLLDSPLHSLHVPEALLHPVSFAIALVVTVFFHVVIGEMVPKNIALARPERLAMLLTPQLVFIVGIIKPVVTSLNWLANMILRMLGAHARPGVDSTYTRDEMADLVKESREEGLLSEDDEQLLSGALTFDSQSVGNIVRPLEDFKSIDRTATYREIEELTVNSGFSRFPVVENIKGEENIAGYVHIKDVIKADEAIRGDKLQAKDIRTLVTVSASHSARQTLKTMQHSGAHIALVKSGNQNLGLVTLENVLTELVGEMRQKRQGLQPVDS